MRKFLLIGSVAAMLYGDCVWGMDDDIDPWRSASSSESRNQQDRESTSFNLPRRSRSSSRASLKNEDPKPTTDIKYKNATKDQNRFIKIGGGAKINYLYLQYHYNSLDNALVGQATPTTIETITGDDLRGWSDISEIRYANDMSYDKLENPKAILYRNMDKSCYIILRIKDTKYDVFYGLNERNIEVGRSSFAVYEVSEDVGSFTDDVPRRIYVDESGLYFVPIEGNSIKDVIKTYQSEGKFNFKGSVIKVSAIDGSITLNGAPITEDNFFDNWVRKEVENRAPVNLKQVKTVLSTAQPKTNEILRNFYPPEGSYRGIYWARYQSSGNTYSGWLNAYGRSIYGGEIANLINKIWLNSFINTRVSIENSKSKGGAEELVRNGTFSSILSIHTDKRYSGHGYDDNTNGYSQKVRDALSVQVAARGERTTSPYNPKRSASISDMVSKNSALFKDPDFVKSLKPAFAELEKDYEHNKESEMWIPFEIVRNL